MEIFAGYESRGLDVCSTADVISLASESCNVHNIYSDLYISPDRDDLDVLLRGANPLVSEADGVLGSCF